MTQIAASDGTTRRTLLAAGLPTAAAGASARAGAAIAAAASGSMPDAEIRALLADRIGAQHLAEGMIVGIVTPRGRRIIACGRDDARDPRPIMADSVFEIGSITKIFTALVLADLVHRGKVALDEPVARLLPPGIRIPEHDGRAITLLDLATQTSGLPFAPSDLVVTDPGSYAAYADARLFAFLGSYSLPRDPGSKWEYSNLGFALLTHALVHRTGRAYGALVHGLVAGPLGMASTATRLSPSMRTRLTPGHAAGPRMARAWEAPAFPGVGELKSTANDLLTLLEACMGLRRTSLAPAIALSLEPRRPGPGFKQDLGWWTISFDGFDHDPGIVTHAGETWGYSANMAFDPRTKTGIVFLSNSGANDGGLVYHLLRPNFPMSRSAAEIAALGRREVKVDPRRLDLYVGRYDGGPQGGVLTIERSGDFLLFKSQGVPGGLRLHADGERSFYTVSADLRFTFESDGTRPAGAMMVRFGSVEFRAARIEGGAPSR